MREESSLSHQRPGLGRGSPQSTPRRARRLTANVKRRNLLRSTGLSRAAPDLMDSQICREEKQRQGRSRGLLPPPSQEHMELRGSAPSCPQAQHTHPGPPAETEESPEASSLLLGLSIREETQPVHALVTAFHRCLLIVNYRASTSGLQKLRGTVPSLQKLRAWERAGHPCLYAAGSRGSRRRADSTWEKP